MIAVEKLYQNLVKLTNNPAFNLLEKSLDDTTYHIFSYQIASYTDFCEDSALEARGIMFEVDDGEPVRIASRTPLKFFNYRENPFTMDIDFNANPLIRATVKEDGSLISTYTHSDGSLRLKTKQSLDSQQALDAAQWLENTNDGQMLKTMLERAEQTGWTVSLEWCSPENRIVVSYKAPKLVVLLARWRDSGEYVSRNQLVNLFGSFVVNEFRKPEGESTATFLENVRNSTDNFEGIVCTCKDGLTFKLKTDKYSSLHHVKDSISSPRRLFNAILDEAVDDVKSLFADDVLLIQEIEDMEAKVHEIRNKLITNVESFFENNKHLDRKEFAILGQQELDRIQFASAMQLYSGKIPDYKQMIKKNWKQLGIKDDE